MLSRASPMWYQQLLLLPCEPGRPWCRPLTYPSMVADKKHARLSFLSSIYGYCSPMIHEVACKTSVSNSAPSPTHALRPRPPACHINKALRPRPPFLSGLRPLGCPLPPATHCTEVPPHLGVPLTRRRQSSLNTQCAPLVCTGSDASLAQRPRCVTVPFPRPRLPVAALCVVDGWICDGGSQRTE